MAHNLYSSRSMMYVGQTPWHGLGISFPANARYEEIAPAVGFYEVREAPLFAAGVPYELNTHKAIIRTDSNAPLAVVGKDYGVIQIEEGARAVLEAASSVDGAIFHTAGLLGENGARWWLLGELGEPITINGCDSVIHPYILATSAHDGTAAFVIQNTPINVVCQNTLTGALQGAGARFYIRHTKNATSRVQDAAKGMRNLINGYERFGQLANEMVRTPFTTGQFSETIDSILPIPADNKPHPKLENMRETIRHLWRNSRGGEGLQNTAWAAWQAWTEFGTHALTDGRDRLESNWFGRGAKVTEMAFAEISKRAEIRV